VTRKATRKPKLEEIEQLFFEAWDHIRPLLQKLDERAKGAPWALVLSKKLKQSREKATLKFEWHRGTILDPNRREVNNKRVRVSGDCVIKPRRKAQRS
jgi:hypothetical protein